MSRRPDAIFDPQFYGEDGHVWYRDAYTAGWFVSLLHPHNGYFQTFPRLAAAAALLVPLRFAPLVMNAIGMTVQVLPLNILLSSRCRNWAPFFLRVIMAIAYIALPNTMELDATVTNAQWHLAFLACILVLASPPATVGWKIFDVSILLLSGLTGPFALVLLPLAFAFWYIKRDQSVLVVVVALGLSAILQSAALVKYGTATRSSAVLGATPEIFVRLLGGQVYLGALVGQTYMPADQNRLLVGLVAIVGTFFVIYCFLRARVEWKLFLAFCMLVFLVSLRNPLVSMTQPQWQVLLKLPGGRYWFLPMIAFVWALIWCAAFGGNVVIRYSAATGLLVMSLGVVEDWSYPAYQDLNFPKYVTEFAKAPVGTLLKIPAYPPGEILPLTKKGGACPKLPTGVVDHPTDGASVSSPVSVGGWVVAPEPIQRLTIYIDRSPVGSLMPDVLRPDVDARYPQYSAKYKGFGTMLDMSHAAPGRHEIEVRALEADGCEADVDVVKIER